MIVSFVHSKGGVGKSTISGSLAGWLHEQGRVVIFVDCDAQESSSEWIRETYPDIRIVRIDNSDDVLDELPELRAEAEFVVCDGPGSQTEMTRALLIWADLAIVPCKASVFEARALEKNTRFIRQVQTIRKGPPQAIVVLSMVGEGYRLTRDMKKAAEALELTLAKTPVTLRQAYADAPGQATVVWRMGSKEKDAASEIVNLFQELFPEVCRGENSTVVKIQRRANDPDS